MSSQLTSFYTSLTSEVGGLLAGERDPIANMANISALVSEKLNVDRDVNWVGFYLMKRNAQKHELVVGPFQGKPACVRIRVGRGVCGTAVEKGVPQVVSDVEKFPGHIACDATSRSEIVIPLRRGEDEVLGVLGKDRMKGAFTSLAFLWLLFAVLFWSPSFVP